MKKTVTKVISTIISVILWIIIALAVIFIITVMTTKDAQNVSNLFGYTPMVVESDSMTGTFEKGDMIIVKQCEPAELEVGDVITFHTIIDNKYALNTHRITNIETENGVRFFTTKGDNPAALEDADRTVESDVVAVWTGTRIPVVGSIMTFLKTPVGFIVVIVIPILAFFIYEIVRAVKAKKKLDEAENAEKNGGTVSEDGTILKAEAENAKLQAELEETKRKIAESENERLKAELEAAKAKLAESEAAKNQTPQA